MKVNNLTKFFNEKNSEEIVAAQRKRSTILTHGDIIKLYCETDSDNPMNWHPVQTTSDKWWKMSFDGGTTFPIKMKFEQTTPKAFFSIESGSEDLTTDQWSTEVGTSGEILSTTFNLEKTFYFGNNDTNAHYDFFESLSKDGNIAVSLVDTNGYSTAISNFKYKWGNGVDNDSKTFTIGIYGNYPGEYSKIDISIKLGGSSPNVASVPTAVFSMPVSAIPTVCDNKYGICNYLDDEIPSITTLTKLDGVNVIKIKTVSADDSLPGYIVVKLKTENWESETMKIFVGTEERVTELKLVEKVSGALTIERLFENENDTLKDAAGGVGVISAIITQIKVEIE